ncbi:SHOCT domain-containing protein [Desulfosediminicola ganghwensis]|uniref:SHOCT domain-containing protein n=1 Tax=Desulfosediminicola ganghwensis TaxID=2569540 RepID=UPI0010AC024C|nr:hypothetical protein [Desulfosediminicola ganghwensis]
MLKFTLETKPAFAIISDRGFFMWSAHHGSWGGNMGHWWQGGSSWFSIWPHPHGPFLFNWLVPLLFWGIVLYALVSIFRYFASKSNSGATQSAMDILHNRFAAGDISEDEYISRKTVLEKG